MNLKFPDSYRVSQIDMFLGNLFREYLYSVNNNKKKHNMRVVSEVLFGAK